MIEPVCRRISGIGVIGGVVAHARTNFHVGKEMVLQELVKVCHVCPGIAAYTYRITGWMGEVGESHMTPIEVVQTLLWGATVGVVLAAPIGPINIEIIRRGLRDGFWQGWQMGLGALTADTLWAMAIVLGFARFAGSDNVRVILFLAGAAMMGFVGLNSLKTGLRGIDSDAAGKPTPRGASLVTGFLMAALNPLGIVYWLTVGAGLAADAVTRGGEGAAPVLVLGVTIGILCWVTVLSIIAQVSRRFVTGRGMRWITGVSGALMVGFSVWFLYNGARLLLT